MDAEISASVGTDCGVGGGLIRRALCESFEDFRCRSSLVGQDCGGCMMGGVGWTGLENAISMASCNPIEVFPLGVSGSGWNWVVSTVGDTGGSALTTLGEGGDHAVDSAGGSGDIELPGVGSCERSSAIAEGSGRVIRLDWRSLALHHMRTWTGLASRPSAQ